jgi:putative AbiEii toxin of type IV toxin-antitoxin system
VDFTVAGVGKPIDILEDPGPRRTIDLDERVEQNYTRLIAQSVTALWDRTTPDQTTGDIVGRLVGDIAAPLERLLPGLVFEGPSLDPLAHGTFEFTKGSVQRYAYKVLSGGEKAVFDLLLDLATKRATLTDTVYCIDEPELHVNAAIHGALLEEMVGLLPDDCQLIIATHSAGMLASSRAMNDATPGSVAFLDFDGLDTDEPVELTPVTPDRAFWKRQLAIAFGGFADLLAPARVAFCEGDPTMRNSSRASFDARCLATIFGDHLPDTSFMSVGNSDDVEEDRFLQLGDRITALIDGVEIIRIVDRDDKSETEITEARERDVRVLRRRNLECYLLDNEVLTALCAKYSHPEKAQDLIAVRDATLAKGIKDHQWASDDYKRARGATVTAARSLLGITQGGSGDAFLRDTVAPLLNPGMTAYEELRDDIFG